MSDTDRHAVIPEGDGTSEMREDRYHGEGHRPTCSDT